MNFDFALLLVVITGLTGFIWLFDHLFFARKRMAAAVVANASDSGSAPTSEDDSTAAVERYREPVLVEYARSFFPVLLVVLILRSFLFEPFRIPSGSMLPTLLIGDFILVNKFSYGVRLPVIHTKILDTGTPDRGDVAVFRYPKNPSLDFIKRIVGLPGDRIGYLNKQLSINGTPVALEVLGPYLPPDEQRPSSSLLRLVEKFDSAEHEILNTVNTSGIQGHYTVPEGHYFVMGDNRDNSNDSRFWGFVPEDHLVGKAVLIWMNLDFYWDRLGSSVK